MTPSGSILQLTSLRKCFGENEVLCDLNLTLGSGSICTLLGRNGAGKTTTIRLIMGQLRPSGGEVRIFGTDITDPTAHGVWRQVGYLAAEPVLYNHLSGREFLHFLAEVHGIPHSSLARLDDLTLALGLDSSLDFPIRTYSLGTKKKVAFLAAVLHDPEFLVLDEPTGSMDAVSARVIRDFLMRERSRGKLILFSTHIMDEAERISDKVAVLHSGRLVCLGSPEELRSQVSRTPDDHFEDVFLRLTDESSILRTAGDIPRSSIPPGADQR